MCELTQAAMQALIQVTDRLDPAAGEELSASELRTLLWARCSLAVLYGIRADEMTSDVTTIDLDALLAD